MLNIQLGNRFSQMIWKTAAGREGLGSGAQRLALVPLKKAYFSAGSCCYISMDSRSCLFRCSTYYVIDERVPLHQLECRFLPADGLYLPQRLVHIAPQGSSACSQRKLRATNISMFVCIWGEKRTPELP